jgi:catechol 2,3-dioxygenase-like lactoylglutathione lyase family enzyme
MSALHHVNVVCRPGDTDRVAAFYAGVLGLARAPKAPGTDPRGAWFAVDGRAQVHISEREGTPHPDAHFALVVDDLAAVVDRLRRGGHEWRPADPVFGGGRGFTRDPAGNRIELLEGTGARGPGADT